MWRIVRSIQSNNLFRPTNYTNHHRTTASRDTNTTPSYDKSTLPTLGATTLAAVLVLSQYDTLLPNPPPSDGDPTTEGHTTPSYSWYSCGSSPELLSMGHSGCVICEGTSSPMSSPTPTPPSSSSSPPVPTCGEPRSFGNFRERRLTTKYKRLRKNPMNSIFTNNQGGEELSDQTSNNPLGEDTCGDGTETTVPMDTVMYPTPFAPVTGIREEEEKDNVPKPFSPRMVGCCSYHGLEPRFLYGLVEEEEEEEVGMDGSDLGVNGSSSSSTSTSSLLSNLFPSSQSSPDRFHNTDDETGHNPRYKNTPPRQKPMKVLKHKINQDRGHVVRPYGKYETTALFAVYDGHGTKGELLAEYTMQALQEKLRLHPSFPPPHDTITTKPPFRNDDDADNALPPTNNEPMSIALRETLCEIDQEVKRTAHLDSTCSGCTACVAVLRDDTLWIANVGDSRAVLGRRRRQSHKDGDDDGCDVYAIDLSIDQNANDPREKERILRSGGYITFPDDDSLSPRVWLDSRCTMVGLAMSRSIGDHALESVGVVAEPVVERYEVKSGDEFLIVASDGVWEFISSEEAVQIVQTWFDKGLGADRACEELVRAAKNVWKEKEGDYRDDITAIVVRLDNLWNDVGTTTGVEK